MQIAILGRQPKIGLAELESRFGHKSVTPASSYAALLDIAGEIIDINTLGGTTKLANVVGEIKFIDWKNIESQLNELVLKLADKMPDKKVTLGISTYGLKVNPKSINSAALNIKKQLKNTGRNVRVVPNKSTSLNSAQVLHNHLTTESGLEIVLIKNGSKTIVARTIQEQDIESYAKRDQNRPMRDAKVGMLPPKLAQIIINLAGPGNKACVMDPFCGTGVLLQEAALMGFDFYGSDIEPRMVKYTIENLKWLQQNRNLKLNLSQVEQGDATNHTWKHLTPEASNTEVVLACETYLGKPLSSLPPQKLLEEIMDESDQIHRKFLNNIGAQIKPGTRLCLAVPAWNIKPQISNIKYQFLHLKTLAKLSELGYTRKKFVHVNDSELIYHRPDQIVARELVVLEKD